MGESILKVFAAPASREAAAKWLAEVEAVFPQGSPHLIAWADAAFLADLELMNHAVTARGKAPGTLLVVISDGSAEASRIFRMYSPIRATATDAVERVILALSQPVRS